MSAPGFRSVFMVASCAAAALGCYLVSLRVASERAALEQVETRIVLAQRDLRLLQTEIGTRGRLAQLERWNAKVLALSAPSADQFLRGGFELARLAQPERAIDFQAPVVLASAPAPAPVRPPVGEPGTDDAGAPTAPSPKALLHEASLKTETREVPAKAVDAMPRSAAPQSKDKPVTAAKPAFPKSTDTPGLAAAKFEPRKGVPPKAAAAPKPSVKQAAEKPAAKASVPASKKSVDKPAASVARPVTKAVRLAKTDPLAPLPVSTSKPRETAADR